MPNSAPLSATTHLDNGATAVISHVIEPANVSDYETWIDNIGKVVKKQPGFLDVHIIYPVKGLTQNYTVIIRFSNRESLEQWLDSEERQRWLAQVEPLLQHSQKLTVHSGLEFLFEPPEASAPVAKSAGPKRWKQFVLTWSGIYPLVLLVPPALTPLLRMLPIPQHRALELIPITGVIVLLMVFLIMPNVSRLLSRWLLR